MALYCWFLTQYTVLVIFAPAGGLFLIQSILQVLLFLYQHESSCHLATIYGLHCLFLCLPFLKYSSSVFYTLSLTLRDTDRSFSVLQLSLLFKEFISNENATCNIWFSFISKLNKRSLVNGFALSWLQMYEITFVMMGAWKWRGRGDYYEMQFVVVVIFASFYVHAILLHNVHMYIRI